MGGCATKPKASKDDVDAKTKAPEPQPEDNSLETKVAPPLGGADNHNVNETVDDDQANNKRRSLSLLFKENEDAKVSTENEKTDVEETVKQETLEAEKPLEDTKSNEPIVKQESPKAEQKLHEESKHNEAAKQEPPLVEVQEKSSVQTQSTNPAEETVKTEETQSNEPTENTVKSESETEKPSEENNHSSESLKEESGEANETSSVETKSHEPIKESLSGSTNEPPEAEKPSEKSEENDLKAEAQIEDTKNTEVVPLPEEKVIEVVSTGSESVEKITDEEVTTSSIEEKKNHTGVEHTSKVVADGNADADAVSEIH